MNDIAINIDQDNLRVGREIRDLRKAKGITLSYLAEKIGKSVGYISQVERGVSALPVPTLQAISNVLEVKITWFFHSEKPLSDEANYVVRKEDRRHLDFFGTGIHEELLSPRLSGDLLMIMTTFAPKAQSHDEPRKRISEEIGYVKSGVMELKVDDKSFLLNAGDSFSISEKDNYIVRNPSATDETLVLWVLKSFQY